MAELVPDEIEAPVEAPAGISSPEPVPSGPSTDTQGDALDQLLAEFDRGNPAPAPSAGPEQPQHEQQADPLELSNAGPSPDAVAAGARALFEEEVGRAQMREQFNAHCGRIQERLPEYVPEDYARSELLAMSVSDPRIEISFYAQNVNPVAVRVELDKVNAALVQAKTNWARPEVIQALERRQWELQVARQARTIIKQAESAIIRKAKSRPPVDPDLTSDHAAVAASMRGASAPIGPEPPPNFAAMTDRELAEYTKQNFGF